MTHVTIHVLACMQAVDGVLCNLPQLASEQDRQGRASIYLPDRGALSQAGASGWPFLPPATQTLLLQRVQPLSGNQRAADGLEGKGEVMQNGPRGESGGDKSLGPTGVMSDGKRTRDGWLILASATPRALSRRERLWASAIAAKLHSVLLTDAPLG